MAWKLFCVVAVAALFVAGARADDEIGDPGDVVVLTSLNFESKLESLASGEQTLLVEFYAPWCGHCKTLAPKYKEAATELLKNDPPLHIAMMDADDENNKEIASRFGVAGFPTLKFFRDAGATVLDFDGPRETEDIVKAVKQAQGAWFKEVKATSEVDATSKKAKDEGKKGVLLFAGKEPRDGSAAYTTFKNLAWKAKAVYYALATFDKDVIASMGVDPPALQLITADGKKAVLSTPKDLRDEKKIKAWLKKAVKPKE